MVEGVKNVIFPEEIVFHVRSLKNYRVSDIGKTFWFKNHEILVKIHQQTILEAKESREEVLKDALMLEGKCKTLVYNAYVILIWRHKVLPGLMAKGLQPQSSFIFYTIFFHEATLMGLLETLLYYPEACEALEETSLDLIDYCLQAIIQLIALGRENAEEEIQEIPVEEEVLNHQKSLQFSIGIRCLSILFFLVDNLERISLSAATRLLEIHDTPCVLAEILHLRPWMRRRGQSFEHFNNDSWQPVAGEEISRVTKSEAHTWFCLREILLNSRLFSNYQVNDFRQKEISKVQGLLNDVLLDQLPPLADLKQFLVTFCVSRDFGGQGKEKKLLLEELPQIRESLLEEIQSGQGGGSFESFDVGEIAQILSKAYDFEVMDSLLSKETAKNATSCSQCGLPASKKCSKCLRINYCSRECQKKHWISHKINCKDVGGV